MSIARRAPGIPGNAFRRTGSTDRNVIMIRMLRARSVGFFNESFDEMCAICGGPGTLVLRPVEGFMRMVKFVWPDRAAWVVDAESGPEVVHVKCDIETIEHVGERALALTQAIELASGLIDLNRCGLFRKRLDRLSFEDWALKQRARIRRQLDALWSS